MTNCDTCDANNVAKSLRFLFAMLFIIATTVSEAILSMYAIIGTDYIVTFLKISGDSLGYAFLSVTLYGSHLVIIGYILITGLNWLLDIFGDDIQKGIDYLRKFRITRIKEANTGEL